MTINTKAIIIMINQVQDQLNWELWDACETGDIVAIRTLLESGVDINIQFQNNGETPLHLAVMNGPTEAVKFLLKKGAYINTQTSDGWTALYVAALEGYAEVVRMLLEGGADLNAQIDDGRTTLSWVKRVDYPAQGNNFNTIKLLVETAQFADDIYNQAQEPALPCSPEDIDQDLLKARIKHAILTNQPDLEPSINIIKAIDAVKDIIPEVYQEIIIERIKIYPEIKVHPEINNEVIASSLENTMMYEAALMHACNESMPMNPLVLTINQFEAFEHDAAFFNLKEPYCEIYPEHSDLLRKFFDQAITAEEQKELIKGLKISSGNFLAKLGIVGIVDLIGRNPDQNPCLLAMLEAMDDTLLSQESFEVLNQFKEATQDEISWGALMEELGLDTEHNLQYQESVIDQGESKIELIGDDA